MAALATNLRTTAVVAEAVTTKLSEKPPMEAVAVNSIIYSKPAFCTIAVDLCNVPPVKNKLAMKKLKNGTRPNNHTFHKTMDLDTSCLTPSSRPTPSTVVDKDAKVYRMCTTISGSTHHHISELCDDIIAIAEYFRSPKNEDDDDSIIEFAYSDDDLNAGDNLYNDSNDDETDDDEEEEEDYIDGEDENFDDDDDDDDVVEFSYECPVEPVSKRSCDKKKKVRFDTKATVHVMHTWNFAYRAARKGEWEMYARDRERFKFRIEKAALTLNRILERKHRQEIYEKRFSNLYNNDDNGQRQETKNQDPTFVDKKGVSSEKMENKETSNIESKKPHQKKKRKKKKYCKMGNKHYF